MNNQNLVTASNQLEVNQVNHGRTKKASKRVNIVKVKLVREKSVLYENRVISSPKDAYNLFHQFLHETDREHFLVLCLDTKNQPTAINIVHQGTLNASIVHPREVFKPAILSNSNAILIAHNHPSNDPKESDEDIAVTHRLAEAGKIIGIELLDHLIVCDHSYVSLKDKGHF